MSFFKKFKLKSNGKWYPRSLVVGDPATTDEVADRLAQISTVSRGDTYNVLKDLAMAMKSFMKEGRSVKLDGVGTFYYTADASGQGVDTPEEVSAKQIKGVRVRFIQEFSRTSSNKVSTRSLVDDDIQWLDIDTLDPAKQGSGTTTTPGGSDNEDGEGTFG
ncbi:MAG TPA: HU family DNA-binding protein [Candidatus Bacteroides merdipullorum]|uniref:HU family DNA-binding protein n=1 Tax=Candidatus Bacteroides merdipullorum TaxID=2838474 RepID=A0A9D2A6V9_9BACE|nr:HU family DNA-binding protein [Candidatus Bacteroides merdipullorum]